MKLEKVTFFSREPITSAIEQLRVMGPLSYLNVEILPGIINGLISRENIEIGQLIIFQRDFPEQLEQYNEITKIARLLSKPIIFDMDDLLIALPENHPDRKSAYFSKALLPMVQALVEADYVTVSTNKLREALSQFNDEIFVLPNLLDDRIWSLKTPGKQSESGIVTVGYMGGNSHKPDLEFVLPILLEIAEKYHGRVNFNFYGIQPPAMLMEHAEVRWSPIKTFDYQEFASDFQQFEADIVIAPLGDNIFNRCKSGIKFLEYSALGIPGVYSNLEPYSSMVTQGENGLLATSQDDWKNSLCKLIEDPILRIRIGINAQECVRNNWLMSSNAELWREHYENIISSEPRRFTLRHLPISNLNEISTQLIEVQDQLTKKIRGLEELVQERENELTEQTSIQNKQAAKYDLKLVELNSSLIELGENYNNSQRLIESKTSELEKCKSEFSKISFQLDQREHELNEIYTSKAWKVAVLIRQARVRLLPSGSKRFRFVRNIYRSIMLYRRSRISKPKPLGIPTTPLISVVIPVYDRTQMLIDSIESILQQTYHNFELIIVCDGSPEETLDIVKQYEKTSPKVRAYYFNNNSGNAVRGRNKGIKEALGEYLAFQDSDDIAEPNRLEISLDIIQKYNADIVYGGWKALVDGTREINIKNGEVIFSPECNIELLKQVCIPCQSTVMTKVEALRAVGGLKNSMRYREDHELWLRLANSGYKFKTINQVLTNLRLHKNNLEINFKESDDYWYKLMLDEYKKIYPLRPKIGYVIPGTGISGGIAVICEHANRLLQRGYDITLISEDNKTNISWYPNQLVEVIPLDKAADNYDILIATGWTTAYSVLNLKAKRKFYFVQSDESRFYEENDPIIPKVLKTYELDFEFITEAKWIQSWLKNKYSKNAVYVPNGLNEKIIFEDTPMIAKGEKLRVLLEGPIDIPFKGVGDAYEAVKDLDCEIWVVSSSGRPKNDWRVDQFFHKVPFGTMRNIYSSCDILLKMSRVEGFFGPPLEMMACGGAVVVSKVTGYEEYIIHEYNALVVETGDIEGAKNAVKILLENDLLRKSLIANGKRTTEKWKWDNTIDTLEKLYYPHISMVSNQIQSLTTNQ